MTDEDARIEKATGPGGPQQFIAIIPGGGWMLYYSDGERGWSEPVIAWVLQADGAIMPVETASEGSTLALAVDYGRGSGPELWHPDSSSAKAQARLQHHRDQLQRGGA